MKNERTRNTLGPDTVMRDCVWDSREKSLLQEKHSRSGYMGFNRMGVVQCKGWNCLLEREVTFH